VLGRASVPWVKPLSEFEAIALIGRFASRTHQTLGGRSSSHVELGIGDDAALLRIGKERLLVSVDACVEGVHFERDLIGLSDLGFKATQAALSDLASMAANPLGLTSALTLPVGFSRTELLQLTRGQLAAVKLAKCPMIGGNIARSPQLSLTTTVLGKARKPVLRSGARPGDEVWLIGPVGLAALGLALLRARQRPRLAKGSAPHARLGLSAFEWSCVQSWRRPIARLSEGLKLAARAHSLIDVSDGLAQDLGHIAQASQVKIIVDAAQIKSGWPPHFARTCEKLGLAPLELSLTGGEDYALLATGFRLKRPPFARSIGVVERGKGTWLHTEGGKLRRLSQGGFDHLRVS